MKGDGEAELVAMARAGPKLIEEVKSWRSFAKALRFEDRQLFYKMLEKIWNCADAVENCTEGYVTEAFLLSLLISQQKTIDQLIEKKKRCRDE